MKKLLAMLLVTIVSGCANAPVYEDTSGYMSAQEESAHRVRAYQKAGMDPMGTFDAYEARRRDYEAHRRTGDPLAPLERLNAQWRRPAASQEATAPSGQACRQVSLRDPATGLFKQYRVCD